MTAAVWRLVWDSRSDTWDKVVTLAFEHKDIKGKGNSVHFSLIDAGIFRGIRMKENVSLDFFPQNSSTSILAHHPKEVVEKKVY